MGSAAGSDDRKKTFDLTNFQFFFQKIGAYGLRSSTYHIIEVY